MPKRKYKHREPTHDWQELRPLLKDPAQITYEIIRPVILFGMTSKERAEQTGMPQRTIRYKANLFDVSGMASLLPPETPPTVPQLDKRALPPFSRGGFLVSALAKLAHCSLGEEYPGHRATR